MCRHKTSNPRLESINLLLAVSTSEDGSMALCPLRLSSGSPFNTARRHLKRMCSMGGTKHSMGRYSSVGDAPYLGMGLKVDSPRMVKSGNLDSCDSKVVCPVCTGHCLQRVICRWNLPGKSQKQSQMCGVILQRKEELPGAIKQLFPLSESLIQSQCHEYEIWGFLSVFYKATFQTSPSETTKHCTAQGWPQSHLPSCFFPQ